MARENRRFDFKTNEIDDIINQLMNSSLDERNERDELDIAMGNIRISTSYTGNLINISEFIHFLGEFDPNNFNPQNEKTQLDTYIEMGKKYIKQSHSMENLTNTPEAISTLRSIYMSLVRLILYSSGLTVEDYNKKSPEYIVKVLGSLFVVAHSNTHHYSVPFIAKGVDIMTLGVEITTELIIALMIIFFLYQNVDFTYLTEVIEEIKSFRLACITRVENNTKHFLPNKRKRIKGYVSHWEEETHHLGGIAREIANLYKKRIRKSGPARNLPKRSYKFKPY